MNETVIILSRSFVVLLALLLLGFIAPSGAFSQKKTPANAQKTPSNPQKTPAKPPTNLKIPFNRTVVTNCAEKTIRLKGEFQAQFSVTRDPSGDTFMKADFNALRVTAVGLSSGSKYQAHGTSHFDSRGPSPIEFNYVFNFALNKLNSLDSLMGHVKFRIKVTPKGATTAIVDVNVDCNQ